MKSRVQEFEQSIVQWANRHARSLGLRQGRIDAAYIRNPGGFVNLPCRLTDGERRLHVKLAPADRAECLRQWAAVGDRLTRQYHAPRIVDVITRELVPGYPFGIVIEYATVCISPGLRRIYGRSPTDGRCLISCRAGFSTGSAKKSNGCGKRRNVRRCSAARRMMSCTTI